MLNDILNGIAMLAEPMTLLLIIFGVILGSILGAIPGLTATMAIALLLPFTFSLPTVASIVFLTSMYKGGIFGGSISAILLNTPGTSAAAATAMDGYRLAEQGKGRKAIKMAIFASSAGDLFACIVLIFLSGFIAKFALVFGPPEYTALILFSFTVVLGVSQKSLIKGMLATTVGILISTIGYDPTTGMPRFSFGSLSLSSGIDLIPMLIGLLAVSEIFLQMEKVITKKKEGKPELVNKTTVDNSSLSWKEIKQSKGIIMQSGAIGTIIGALPGLGPTVAAFLGHQSGRRLAKDKENYGKGALEGVAAPEAANSAVGSSNLIPLISLGIPGDAEAALILAALVIQGITPGPQMFETNGPIIYGIFGGLIIAILANFLFNWYFSKWAIKVKDVPMRLLIPVILVLCIAGSYGINQDIFDVKTMIIFGLIGYLMVKFEFPTTALLIGFILAPIFERSFRQSMLLSDNNPVVFLQHPIAAFFLAITLLTIIYYLVKEIKGRSE